MRSIHGKPSDSPMRYFTPELFARVNSENEEVAEEAYEEWEAAVAAYREVLASSLMHAPDRVKEFAQRCFHDAAVTNANWVLDTRVHDPGDPRCRQVAFALTLGTKETIWTLTYSLWEQTGTFQPDVERPAGERVALWLYDEVDRILPHTDLYIHRIMLSDGRVLLVPFVDVAVTEVKLRRWARLHGHRSSDEDR